MVGILMLARVLYIHNTFSYVRYSIHFVFKQKQNLFLNVFLFRLPIVIECYANKKYVK
jgi:hypothetical protein